MAHSNFTAGCLFGDWISPTALQNMLGLCYTIRKFSDTGCDICINSGRNGSLVPLKHDAQGSFPWRPTIYYFHSESVPPADGAYISHYFQCFIWHLLQYGMYITELIVPIYGIFTAGAVTIVAMSINKRWNQFYKNEGK